MAPSEYRHLRKQVDWPFDVGVVPHLWNQIKPFLWGHKPVIARRRGQERIITSTRSETAVKAMAKKVTRCPFRRRNLGKPFRSCPAALSVSSV
jgi:hypothetical protein